MMHDITNHSEVFQSQGLPTYVWTRALRGCLRNPSRLPFHCHSGIAVGRVLPRFRAPRVGGITRGGIQRTFRMIKTSSKSASCQRHYSIHCPPRISPSDVWRIAIRMPDSNPLLPWSCRSPVHICSIVTIVQKKRHDRRDSSPSIPVSYWCTQPYVVWYWQLWYGRGLVVSPGGGSIWLKRLFRWYVCLIRGDIIDIHISNPAVRQRDTDKTKRATHWTRARYAVGSATSAY